MATAVTSQKIGSTTKMREIWSVLYDANAEIVLNGHEHFYERFGPQDPDGRPDHRRGIRQFTVGTGGAPLRERTGISANSELVLSTHGVLKLTLRGEGYDWDFVPVAGFASGLVFGVLAAFVLVHDFTQRRHASPQRVRVRR